MKKSKKTKNSLPLVGFFPLFYNLAETGRALLIAKRYKEIGGKVIFFSHGGEYEKLAKKMGFKVEKVEPIYSDDFIDLLWKSSRLETFKNPFNCKNLEEHIKNEIKAFKKNKVKLIVSTNNWPCYISARILNIPLIFVTPKVTSNFTTYPEDAEFLITYFLPEKLKLRILNWYAPKSKIYVKPFNKIAKKYNIPPPKNDSDINRGDYTFYTNSKELLNIDELKIKSNEYFITPILLDELFKKFFSDKKQYQDEKEVLDHINKNGRSILLTLGSSGSRELFLNILEALGKTDYNVVAVYSSILKDRNLPIVSKNIILKKFLPSMIKINKKVDLAVIHGGEGTVLTAAHSGKPVIGFPMQFEQHLNLEMLVKNKTAIIESRKNFKQEKFLKSIEEIFNNYNFYINNSKKLAEKIPKPKGDKIAIDKIVEILDKTEKR